jgi:hypothetical protein
MNKILSTKFIVICVLFSSNALAINKCIGERGKVSFQDKPCPDSTKSSLPYSSKSNPNKAAISSIDNPEEFFKQYIELSDNFDLAVGSLYSANAKVHSYRIYPHGLERGMELTGAQWQQLLIKAMPLAKAKNDKSSFTNVAVSEQGKSYKIKADRYSLIKCYQDSGYYMIIAPRSGGGFHIIEEYMQTQPQSNC